MSIDLKDFQMISSPVSQNYGVTFNSEYQCNAVMNVNTSNSERDRLQAKLNGIASNAENLGFGLGQVLLKIKERCAATLIRTRTYFFNSLRYFRGEESPKLNPMGPVLKDCVTAEASASKKEMCDKLSVKDSENLSVITKCIHEEVDRYHPRFAKETEDAIFADKWLKQQQECVQSLEPETQLRHDNRMQSNEDLINHLNRFTQNYTQFQDEYSNSMHAILFLDKHFPYPIVNHHNPEPQGLTTPERLQLDQKLDKSPCKPAITVTYGARKQDMRCVKGLINDFHHITDGCTERLKRHLKTSNKFQNI